MAARIDILNNFSCLDGTNDRYDVSGVVMNAALQDSPGIIQAGWFNVSALPSGASSAIVFLPINAGGSTGASIQFQTTGNLVCSSRSRDGGFAASVTFLNCIQTFYKKWTHYIYQTDYVGKTQGLWLNGKPTEKASAVAWEDLSYQPGDVGAGFMRLGASGVFYTGKLGNQYIGKSFRALTDSEALEWYAIGKPNNFPMIDIFEFAVIDGIAAIDTISNIPITPSGISAPYGAQASLYGGLGR